MYKKGYPLIGDIGALTIETKNRKDALTLTKKIRATLPNLKKKFNNFYAKPTGGIYRAYHVQLIDKNKNQLELQIKSSKMAKLHAQLHPYYKREVIPPKKLFRKAKLLFKQGF